MNYSERAREELYPLACEVHTAEDIRWFRSCLAYYNAYLADKELERLWDAGVITEQTMKDWEHEHMRTPYRPDEPHKAPSVLDELRAIEAIPDIADRAKAEVNRIVPEVECEEDYKMIKQCFARFVTYKIQQLKDTQAVLDAYKCEKYEKDCV